MDEKEPPKAARAYAASVICEGYGLDLPDSCFPNSGKTLSSPLNRPFPPIPLIRLRK
jgi:hypothetical protein